MGVNVHLSADELPVPTATSLSLLRPDLGSARNEVIATVLAVLELWLGRWESGEDDAGLRDAYLRRCATVGRRVEVQLPDAQVRGDATGIDEDGRLIVATEAGSQVFGAGDVVHLR